MKTVSQIRSVLTPQQRKLLRSELGGRLLVLCFGAGVDSTAMVVALRAAGVRPDVITFADTGGERRATLAHLHRMNEVLAGWRWPLVDICRKVPMASTGYADLYGNCLKNETLPSLAFGGKSCSVKWKAMPQNHFLKGARTGPGARAPHPVWTEAVASRRRIVKLIGYDCGRADMRRSSRASATSDTDFDFLYPLQLLGWTRRDCLSAIAQALGPDMVPIKSACFFCPATKQHELYWLAAHEPDLLELALHLERKALTGKHSRFDAVEFGASWEELVGTSDRFPSSKTTVGLGRSFAWNQWARVNGVVDEQFKVRRELASVFAAEAALRARDDNSLDARTWRIVEVAHA